MREDIDAFLMLISSDFMYDLWPILSNKFNSSMQQDARYIVMNNLNGINSFWEIDFSQKRLENTVKCFYKAGKYHKEFLDDLVHHTRKAETDFWLLSSITEHFIHNLNDKELVSKIKAVWSSTSDLSEVIEKSYNDSNTSWDIFLKEKTEEIQNYLADFAIAQISWPNHFMSFWKKIISILSQDELKDLKEKYQKYASILASYEEILVYPD